MAVDLDEMRTIAHAAADAARTVTLRHFRRPLRIHSKRDDFDPVTIADRDAEAAMRAVIAERRPSDSILGEEAAPVDGSSGLTWVLDPIDGTRGYVSGTPTWGTLIGLRDGGRVLYGMIDQPFTGERFEGPPGRWNRGDETRDLHVRGTTALADTTLLTTFPEVGTDGQRAAFHRLADHCRLTRYGMDCYGYALLAAGCVDLVVEAGLQPYDIAGPIGVVEAAGGIVTSWDGGSAVDGGTALAAATPELHAAAMRILNG